MQRGTGRGDDFFGFRDSFPSSRGFSRARSLSSSFFGGRGLFDDPFFTEPFFTQPLRNIMSPSIFENSIFGAHDNPFGDASRTEILEHQPLHQHSTGPIIQEIDDDDDVDVEASDENAKGHEENLRSGKESHFEDSMVESRGVQKHSNSQNELRISSDRRPQASNYTFHSSSMTYGGINGPYYTASTNRRMGTDGVLMEESKEADMTSGRATHRVSRGIHDKGHSLTRKLNSDGRVDSLQTLHNLNEDELPGFEAAWKCNAGQTLMGWKPGIGMREQGNMRGSRSQDGRSSRVIDIEVLPSTTDHVDVSKGTGSQL